MDKNLDRNLDKRIDLDAMDLSEVEKPSRYIGGEVNTVVKENPALRFCFAFPDVYEVGMSYVGLHLLYQMINEIPDIAMERTFMPWVDMIAKMQAHQIPLFTYETRTPVGEVDVLGFTLQYELSFSNLVKMLHLSGIPSRSRDRGDGFPLVVAGGPCATNPEPIAEIVDLFMIGEGEEMMPEVLNLAKKYDVRSADGRRAFLEAAREIEGVYVPIFYVPEYRGEVISTYRMHDGSPLRKVKRRIAEASYRYTKQIVPFTEIVHDRVSVEVFRGCTRGCRFCQAGMIYRPIRENSRDSLLCQAGALIENTGYDELSIMSLSSLDYSEVEDLVSGLLDKFEKEGVSVSLPSLRMDATSVSVLKNIQKVRKTGLTFAPEAGTQRMRDVINKGVTDEDIKNTFEDIFSLGWFRVKLYFMIGLPTEQDEDIEGIINVAKRALWIFKRVKPDDMKKSCEVTASASCFVPKPFTPFQWVPQCSIAEFERKIEVLKAANPGRKITLNYHAPLESWLEGVFARGDRRLSEVIIKAVEMGCLFDGWSEHFKFDKWMEAFALCGLDPKIFNERERSYDEFLPWDFIDCGISKEFLWHEYQKAIRAEITHDCRYGCVGCGVGCLSPDGYATYRFSDDSNFKLKNRKLFPIAGENSEQKNKVRQKDEAEERERRGLV